MNQLLRNIKRSQIAFFFCALFLFSLIFSKFLLSVSMIGLVLIVLLEVETNPSWKIRFNSSLKSNVSYFFSQKVYLAVTLIFWIVLLSGLASADQGYWLERLRIKLPFLILPFVFASLPRFTKEDLNKLLLVLLALATIGSVGVGVNYLLNYEELNLLISRGQAIPTPTNHIRFSLILTLAVVGGWLLYREDSYWSNKSAKIAVLSATIFLVVFIHVLSVRSGLLALYASVFILAIWEIVKAKKILLGVGVLIGLFVLPVIAVKTIPSLQAKWRFVSYDLHRMRVDNDFRHSDSGRVLSLKVGWSLFLENPVFGVGAGDLRQAVDDKYQVLYPELESRKMPHNQFMTVLAGAGLLGFLLFIVSIFYPLFYQSNYKHPFFLIIIMIALLSFMVENTIENAVGVAFYLFFVLLMINHLDHNNKKQRIAQER